MVIVPGKFPQIKASHCFDSVIVRREALVDDGVYQVQVFLDVEEHAVLLPELSSVARSPPQLASVNLVLEFLDGAKDALVLIEVVVESVQHLVDVLIDPVTILQLDDQAQRVDV